MLHEACNTDSHLWPRTQPACLPHICNGSSERRGPKQEQMVLSFIGCYITAISVPQTIKICLIICLDFCLS